MSQKTNFAAVYAGFQAPVAALNCGDRCAPYNEGGVPFCCDPRHAVPTLYNEEWEYVKENTGLWRPWEGSTPEETQALQDQTPNGQVLAACLGAALCQRGYRSLTCRAFPFFPYLTREGEFLGMSYYWTFEDRCWVISNLQAVSLEYRSQFIATYDRLFEDMPEERENFRYHSTVMRRIFGRRRRSIRLLHRNGKTYKVTPRSGRLRRVDPHDLPKFGPYQVMAELPFPDEVMA